MPKRTRHRGSPPPELFLDRGLGRNYVADALREEGLTVHVADDVFGGDDPTWRPDEIWLPEVTRRGWVILMKDDRVRMKPLERRALIRSKARCFCITTANLTGPQMAERFVKHKGGIIRRSRKPGPYVYGVYDGGVDRLFPPDPARLRG